MQKLLNKIKNNYIDILINISFILIYLSIFLILTKNGKYIYGSEMDFQTQHYFLPDYIRKLFYSTGDLFPSFAFNLAGGTNIYNLAYYGLFNPIIVFSYLFPFVDMLDYIIISTSLSVIISTSLFYFYLRNKKHSYLISYTSAMLFMCATPIIFHSHRHIMFMNYLPFLLLGFFGIDRYNNKKSSTLLIISVVLMILTSYFFSVSGIVALYILGLYEYLNNKKVKFKDIINYTFNIAIRFLNAVLISAILIVPTLYALLTGRGGGNKTSLKEILIPQNNLLYGHYAMGLTLVSLVSMIYFIFKKDKKNKFLAIILLISSFIPIVSYILNGLLYVNGKALIPFIPLALILVSEFLKDIYQKIKFKKVISLYLIISALIICINTSKNDTLIEKTKNNNKIYESKINEIINNDDLYRIKSNTISKENINKVSNIHEYKTSSYLSSNNKKYSKLFKYTFENPLLVRNNMFYSSASNILYEIYMGEKYTFTNSNYNNLYTKIDNYDDINIYKNDYVLPIGYATNNYININEYNKLSYPESAINLLGNVVNDKKTNTEIIKTETIDFNYELVSKDNLEIEKTSNGYIVNSEDNGKIVLKTNNNFDNKIVFIKFTLEDNNKCLYKDLRIKINDIENVLTCKKWKYYNDNRLFNYTLTEGANELDISFVKGKYIIHDIEIKTLDYNYIKEINKKVDPFIINKDKTKGDNIYGEIDAKEDSTFIISIPYDRGFTITLDNNKIDYYETNEAFIGFPISKGKHEIKINYKAPGRNIGIILSIIGLIGLIITILYEKKLRGVLHDKKHKTK